MKSYLDKAKIDYVLFHLNHHIDIDELRPFFHFIKNSEEILNYEGKILFLLNNDVFNKKKIKAINNIPVLFPVLDRADFFYEEKGNLIFSHDILKSIFYLLSGYQELDNSNCDTHGRFQYKESIQYKLNITEKPIVNYYFEVIKKALKSYAKKKEIQLKDKSLFDEASFLLTHDLDLIKKYTPRYVLFRLKRIIQDSKNRNEHTKEIIRTLKHLFTKPISDDPYWTYDILNQSNQGKNLPIYFILPEKGSDNSNYRLKGRYYKKFCREIIPASSIGLHASYHAYNKGAIMQPEKEKLEKSCGQSINSVRNHFLRYDISTTPYIHEEYFDMDFSLGFAEQIGFRNSYCHPFKLYDFKNNRMFRHWEIPLNIMDASLFVYNKFTYEQALNECQAIANEVTKFNGLLTILWHNSFLDEDELPGIKMFYSQITKALSNLPHVNTNTLSAMLSN